MNVLLTGGAGYIGSHIAVVLMDLGHRVVLYDNLSNSSDSVLDKLGRITCQHVSFVRGDVRDTELLVNTLNHNEINAVIHCAGLKAVGESIEIPVDYYANNVHGTVSLLQAMQAEKVKKLVFSSSATIYGEPKYLPIDENHPIGAINPYGRSKLHIEEMLNDVAKSDSQWSVACLRYFNPVGAHESGLIGENPNGVPDNLMPYIAQVASGQREELSVFGGDYPTHDGTGVRDYIHVMDLADAHATALNFLTTNRGWHAINLGVGKGYSVFEIVRAFEKSSGRMVPLKVVARRVGDVAECYADTKFAVKLLNWIAKRNLEQMCSSTWQFQQNLVLNFNKESSS